MHACILFITTYTFSQSKSGNLCGLAEKKLVAKKYETMVSESQHAFWQVTVVEFMDKICPTMDQEIIQAFQKSLKKWVTLFAGSVLMYKHSK